MNARVTLFIVGIVGMFIVSIYYGFDLGNAPDVVFQGRRLNFTYDIFLSVGISAITAFIIGFIYEFVVKEADSRQLTNVLNRNAEAILEKVPSVVVNFSLIWEALPPNSVRQFLRLIVNRIVKDEKLTEHVISRVISYESIEDKIWRNLSHSINVNDSYDLDQYYYMENTVAFRENCSIKKGGTIEKNFGFFESIESLRKIEATGVKIDQYWTVPKGIFDYIESGVLEEGVLGLQSCSLIGAPKVTSLGQSHVRRLHDLEGALVNGRSRIYACKASIVESNIEFLDTNYTIGTFTKKSNPLVAIYLRNPATSIDISIACSSPTMEVLEPILFFPPDQSISCWHQAHKAGIKIFDVALNGHGVIFRLQKTA